MSLSQLTQLSTPAPSALDFEIWANPTDLSGNKDAMRFVVQVLIAASNAQGELVRVMSFRMTLNLDEIKNVNELLDFMNTAQHNSTGPNITGTMSLTYGGGNRADSQALIDKLVAAGVPAGYLRLGQVPNGSGGYVDGGPTSSAIGTDVAEIQPIIDQLRLHLDTVNSTTQKDQLSLQTGIGRFNSLLETITAILKKIESLSSSVTGNFRAA